MPVTSQAQRRAMYAAAEGKSKLGIPKAVGKEMIASGGMHGGAKVPKKAKVPLPKHFRKIGK